MTSLYNFPINNDITHVTEIFDSTNTSFRLNIAFGIILQHVETDRFRHFKPYHNATCFDMPLMVARCVDLMEIRRELESLELNEYLHQQRPNTKWKPFMVTKIVYFVYNTSYPLGHLTRPLPSYVKQNPTVISLDYNTDTGKPYEDNLCAFRALAAHRNRGKRNLTKLAQTYSKQWFRYHRLRAADRRTATTAFKGVRLDDIPDFENCFKIRVHVFELTAKDVAKTIYLSSSDYLPEMNLNLYDTHLSYITNISVYCKKYQCRCYKRLFPTPKRCRKHEKCCSLQAKKIFTGGFYQRPLSIFEQLEEYGIKVKEDNRYFPWFMVFDFEALLMETGHQRLKKLLWTHEHRPISVSICSSVSGFEREHCIVGSRFGVLLEKMVNYMENIAQVTNKMATDKWKDAIDSVDSLLEKWTAADDANSENNCDMEAMESEA